MKVVGVIGLGNMGSAIAEQINKHPYQVIGFDIDKSKCEAINQIGIETEDEIESVAQKADYIILSMPKSKISKGIIEAVSPLMKKTAMIIETSTVLPDEMVEFREICGAHQIKIIDAAILGGVGHMTSNTAELLVGDSDGIFSEVHDVLLSFSQHVHLMGEIGSGMAAKVINNGVAHAVMSVIVESSSLAMKLGIDPERIYELLKGETALLRPLTHRYHERIQKGNYEGGMSTNNARKDSALFLKLAQEKGVPLFSVQSAHTVYDIAAESGYSQKDYSSIAKLWEEWVDIDFTAEKELSK